MKEIEPMNLTRILALLLVLAAPLTLAACGEDDDREIENGEIEDD